MRCPACGNADTIRVCEGRSAAASRSLRASIATRMHWPNVQIVKASSPASYRTATPEHRGRNAVPLAPGRAPREPANTRTASGEERSAEAARAFKVVRSLLPIDASTDLLPVAARNSLSKTPRSAAGGARCTVDRRSVVPRRSTVPRGRLYPQRLAVPMEVNGGSTALPRAIAPAKIDLTDGEISPAGRSRPPHGLHRSHCACIILRQIGMLPETTMFAHSDCTSKNSFGLKPAGLA